MIYRGIHFLIWTFLFLGFATQMLVAGAWAQKKNGYFFKIAINYLSTEKEFNHLGEKIDIFRDLEVYHNARFEDFNANIYFEYGLFPQFTLIGGLPFKQSVSTRTEESVYFGDREVTRTTTGFADLALSGRLQIFNKPLAVSIQGGIKIPLGYDKTPENDGPTLGTGELDGELLLLLGRSLYPLPLYTTAGIGYRSRGGRFNDEILYNFEVGYTPGKWLFKLTLDGIQNTATPPDLYGRTLVLPLPGGGGVTPELLFGDQHILKLIPGVIFRFSQGLALQAEAIHVLAGTNTVAGTTFSLGLVFLK